MIVLERSYSLQSILLRIFSNISSIRPKRWSRYCWMAESSPSIFEVSCLNWLSRASALLLFSLSLVIDRFAKLESCWSILVFNYHRGLPSINHLEFWSKGVDGEKGLGTRILSEALKIFVKKTPQFSNRMNFEENESNPCSIGWGSTLSETLILFSK